MRLLRVIFLSYVHLASKYGFLFFFSCTLYSVYCYMGVFDKYDDFAKWVDKMEPEDTSGT